MKACLLVLGIIPEKFERYLPQKGDTHMEIIALDAHKRYSQVCVQKQNGQFLCEKRINHGRGEIGDFLSRWRVGSSVALETVGNWYWIVDEIEKAGMKPKLVHAKAVGAVGRHLAEASFWVLTK